MQAENVLQNAMTRIHFMDECEIAKASSAFLKQQTKLEKSSISLAAGNLDISGRTFLSNSFLQANKVFMFGQIVLNVIIYFKVISSNLAM